MFINTDLGQIIYSFSKALDLSANGIKYHHQIVALVASALAAELRLPDQQRDLLFLAALVHDAGIISEEEHINLISFEDKKPHEHCHRGYEIFKNSNYTAEIANILLHHHDRWNFAHAADIDENDILFSSNIIYLADRIAVLIESEKGYVLHAKDKIIDKIISGAGRLFNPKVVEAFVSVSQNDAFWLDLQPEIIHDIVSYKRPKVKVRLSTQEITDISFAFSEIIDSKSSYTYYHSENVANIAEFLADKLYFSEFEKSMIKVAGYLHDLGKISVPNYILDKAAKLTKEEFELVKQHTYYSYHLLHSIPGFELIASWGPFHHEKLNGSGYPFQLKSDEIPLGARIIAVSDIFSALTEDRPYRASLPPDKCLFILKDSVQRGEIDGKLVELVEKHYPNLEEIIKNNKSKNPIKLS